MQTDKQRRFYAGENKNIRRGLISLAEAIILQAIDDLWSPAYRKGSIEFFRGGGFGICSEIAGMKHVRQLKLLKMLSQACERPWKKGPFK